MQASKCLRAFGAALILCGSLVGCGGGGSGGSSAPASSGGSPTPAPTPTPTPAPSAGWGSSTRIGALRNEFDYEVYAPSVAITAAGVGFAAWNEATSGSCGRIWANRYAGGSWGSAADIGTTHALSPRIAANATGDAIAVWSERELSTASCDAPITGNEVWGARYTAASGSWSAPFRISIDAPSDSTVFAFAPTVVLDAAGKATVAWLQDSPGTLRSVWQARFDGANWSAPALLSNGTRMAFEPELAIDGSDNVIAVWVQNTNLYDPGLSGGGPQLPNVLASRYAAASGSWSAPQLIGSADLSGFDGTERARVSVNAGGDAAVVWQEQRAGVNSIVAARYAAGSWGAPVALEASSQHAYWPDVAIDVNGNAQAVWVQKANVADPVASGFTARFTAGGAWGAPMLFESAVEEAEIPKVGIDDSGRARIAWGQSISGTPPVRTVHYTPSGGFGTQSQFAGFRFNLAVSASGMALLGSNEVNSFQTTYFGTAARGAIYTP